MASPPNLPTPTIQTQRLLLRPFVREDATDVFAYASNPNVSRFTTWQTHRTLADSDAFIEMVLGRGPDEHTWAIRLLENPHVIGAIEFGLKGDGSSFHQAEFHYVLSEPFWNRGLMTEAASAVLGWGLKNYPTVQRVSTRAMSENVASQRVMEKCGLRFQRVRVGRWPKFAEPVEQREYAIVRGEGAAG